MNKPNLLNPNCQSTWHAWTTAAIQEFLKHHGVPVTQISFRVKYINSDDIITLNPDQNISDEPDIYYVDIEEPKNCILSPDFLQELMFRIQGNLWPYYHESFNHNPLPFEEFATEQDLCLHDYSISFTDNHYTFRFTVCWCH